MGRTPDHVRLLVLGQHEGAGECLATEAALERLLPGVVSHVVPEVKD